MLEHGTREDKPTGTTPRKRTWDYVDKWKLTESRHEILRGWREQGTSNISSEKFLAEHLPLDDIEDVDAKVIEAEPPIELENVAVAGSPEAALLSSSDRTPPLPLKKVLGPQTGIPSLGTLTDSRNVYTTRGLRRAR